MNRNKLKNYAPRARRNFIRAVTEQAAKVGIAKGHSEPVEVKGDVAVIGGRAFPIKVAEQRRNLESRIVFHGFDQVMEEVAYTWFNRFAAIRYMEVHDYLDHGYRVLSHPEGKDLPEILEQADHVNLPGLDRKRVIDLKLDGTKDAELYQMLLIAQCNALHAAMPFLFEKIDDETELLLPDNLLHSDSLIRQMVVEIDEESWHEIEIVGWLYQFYISEKKDQVIGKVVKSEDIPAATQLFTPNWIVKYLVQNSLGAQWLATYPSSPLRDGMDYYIEPAGQSEEVQRQLAEITPKELNPEELTLLDPACGSGHILVEAYDLFKQIYLERGYRLRDIPRLILEKNLYGLDIDDRAAQIAGFALLMKARANDRRILSADNSPKLNVMAIQDSIGLDVDEIARALLPHGPVELVPADDLLPETLPQPSLATTPRTDVTKDTIHAVIDLFKNGKTFGSLITVPEEIVALLPALKQLLVQEGSDDLLKSSARGYAVTALTPLARQAEMLARRHDLVVANPPYMGSKGMNPRLKKFVHDNYPDGKSDLFATFIERGLELVQRRGFSAMVTMQSWMFLSSYEKLRSKLTTSTSLECMAHMANMVMGIAFGTAATVWKSGSLTDSKGAFCFVEYEDIGKNGKPTSFPPENVRNSAASATDGYFRASAEDFRKIPGSPIAYWASDGQLELFSEPSIREYCDAGFGIKTGDNDLFMRFWFEPNMSNIDLHATRDNLSARWYPCASGGPFRKWYGNQELVVDYQGGGKRIEQHARKNGNSFGFNGSKNYFRSSITWPKLTSGANSFRSTPAGHIFDGVGLSAFFDDEVAYKRALQFLNSPLTSILLPMIAPTMSLTSGDFLKLPYFTKGKTDTNNTTRLIALGKSDWDAYETSWAFTTLPLLFLDHRQPTLAETYIHLRAHWQGMREEVQRLEDENNALFIDAYGLADELTPEVPLKEITLTCNPHYRYGSDLSEAEREARLKSDTMHELISYAIGCMMGRYSLGEHGLIYAHAGNEGFDPSRYGEFPADEDGIIPTTDTDWFDDDAARRFGEFLTVAWSRETLVQNLRFVADSLLPKQGETPLDTIRRYLSTGFYKDHLKTYKKRPIYWLFSSGKQKAFECLVYLHRYNESTLSRMRMEYVIPLQGKYAARSEQLDGDIASATSTANRRKLEKEKDSLLKKQAELVEFDDKLRHCADQRIALDLDDGVKVNYGKFGDLLAEVKAITGRKDG